MQTPPWYVLTGGPCSGKTTLINELKERAYSVLPESSRIVIAAEFASGKTVQDIVKAPLELEHLIIAHQLELEAAAPKDIVQFLDRGMPDNVAYYRKFKLTADDAYMQCMQPGRYRKIFLLEMIDFVNDTERFESPEEAKWLHEEIGRVYREIGYDVVDVPVMPVPERADFVLARLN